ncbi:MAG: glycosyltransferase family 4 protein [Actinomycetales bacterium]|nr:glycosyltransferase family 4 protein [Actinomycetales bacterium]
MTGRTLVITNDFPPRPGGIQSFISGALGHLPPERLVVYSSTWQGAAQYDAALPYPVIREDTRTMLPTRAVLRRARSLMAEYACDRVLFGAAAPLGLLARGLRDRAAWQVAMTYGHEAGWATVPGGVPLLRRIGRDLDVVTYLSEDMGRRLRRAFGVRIAARMFHLPAGVDAYQFHPRHGADGERRRAQLGWDGPVIVCISRLVPRKGQDVLIRALPLVHRAIPGARLLIVGGGPDRSRLERQVVRAGLTGRVHLTGGVPAATLPQWYAAGDVFAMPCRTRLGGLDVEGLGIVYLEAAATGLAVVAGASGGSVEAVLPGETGLIVDGRNEAAVAGALITLLGDAPLRERMGRAGRSWVERCWSWPAVGRRLGALLRAEDPDSGQPLTGVAGREGPAPTPMS